MSISHVLVMFQERHVPAAKGSETHHVPNDRLLQGGLLDASTDMDGFVEALAVAVETSEVNGQRLSVYERLHPTFRFFVELTLPDATEQLLRRLFHIAGAALREGSEDTFYPRLDPAALRCVVLHDGAKVRLVFPEVVVDSTRALRLHRHFLGCLDAELSPTEKRMLMSDPPCTDRAFAVFSLERWAAVSPSSVYLDEMGVALVGGTAVVRCTASARRGKTAHDQCAECERSGYVPQQGRLKVRAVLTDATHPALDEAEAERLRGDPAAALVASMLRTTAPLTEPFVVPSFAPVVPMQTDRHGRSELADCFECERATFGTKSRSVRRHDYDLQSNDVSQLCTMASALGACRRMHSAYARITIKRMYKLAGPKPMVRILADGRNAGFCMGKQRAHTGRHACRASFALEMVKGKPRIYQECFSPECTNNKKRYCSNAKELPGSLAVDLGLGRRSSSSDSEMHKSAVRLFSQMRGDKVEETLCWHRGKR